MPFKTKGMASIVPHWFRTLAATHVLEIWFSERTWKCLASLQGAAPYQGHGRGENRDFRTAVKMAVKNLEEE